MYTKNVSGHTLFSERLAHENLRAILILSNGLENKLLPKPFDKFDMTQGWGQ